MVLPMECIWAIYVEKIDGDDVKEGRKIQWEKPLEIHV